MLFIRSGFIQAYHSKPPEERNELALRPHIIGPDDGQRWAGLKQEIPMVDWLHDCYFATVAGDCPAFEAWPTNQDYYLHEYLLALWGCPLGEMVDLESLARKCKERGRWTFFVTSAPANVHGELLPIEPLTRAILMRAQRWGLISRQWHGNLLIPSLHVPSFADLYLLRIGFSRAIVALRK